MSTVDCRLSARVRRGDVLRSNLCTYASGVLPGAEALRIAFATPAPAAVPVLLFQTAEPAGYDDLRQQPDHPQTHVETA